MSYASRNGKNKTLTNLLVNCPSGMMFILSVDCFGYMKKGLKLFELFDSFVEEIGEWKIVKLWPTIVKTMSWQVRVFNC